MHLDKKNMKMIMLLVLFSLILWFVLKNISSVLSGAGWAIGLFTPFIIGGCIAFIVNIPMSWFQNTLFADYKTEGKPFLKKIKDPVSMLLAILLVLLLIAGVMFIIIPQLINALSTIVEKVPAYIQALKEWAENIRDTHPQISQLMTTFGINLDSINNEILSFIKDQGLAILNHTYNAATSVVSTVVNCVIGLVFCIYCLLSKKTLTRQFRKLLYAFCKEPIADKIIRVLRMAVSRFAGFISGQCTESVIIVILYSIVLSIFKFPYAIMIAVTIGVFSLIPIIGSFVACIIGVLLVFLDSPGAVIWFVIVFLVVQQLETNLIYPKVLGGKVGLPSIWVLTAVVVGGNAFGILGMIVMIPLFSLIYALLADRVQVDLVKKNIPDEKLADPVQPPRPKTNWIAKFKLKRKEK